MRKSLLIQTPARARAGLTSRGMRLLLALALLLSSGGAWAQVTVPTANTNTTTARRPYGNYFGFERSAMIYTAGEINAPSGTITSVGFYLQAASTPAATPTRIFLKTTSATGFAAATTVATEEAGATLVYDATIPASAFVAGTWVTVTLTTPFAFSGTSNLEVVVETNGGGTGTEGTAAKAFRFSNGAANSHQYWNADTSPPTTTGTRATSRPNIQLGGLTPNACAAVTPTVGTITATSAQVSFTPVATGVTNYTVTTVPATTTQTVTTSPVSLTGLTPGTAYTVQIVSNCTAGGTSAANTATFTTLSNCAAPTALATNTVTATSANLTFTAVASGVTNYTVTTSPATTTQTVTSATTGSPVVLSGLTAGTAYTVSVVSNCTAGGTSTVATTTFTTLFAVPANDLCANAIALTCGQTVAGTTQGATTVGAPTGTCTTSVTSQPGVFYSYLGTGDIVTVSTCSGPTATSGDTKLFVLGGSCGAFTCVGGNDDNSTACGTNTAASAVTFTSVAGTSYYFYVQGYSTAVPFGLSLTCVAPPACGDPTAALVTIGATTISVAFTPGSGNTSFTFTATPTAGGTAITNTGTASPVQVSGLTPGTSYDLVLVANCAGGLTSGPITGTFTTNVAPPANDECTAAVTLTSAATCAPTSGTVAGATQSLAPILCNSYTAAAPAQDVWYQFTATGTTHTITVTGTFDGVLEVLSGACGATTNVGCSDVTGNNETLTLNTLTVGTIYRVRYYPYSADPSTATFTICVTNPAACAAPTAVAAGSLTQNSASISFTAGNGNTGYTVTYTPQGGTAQTATGTASPIALTGLTAGTQYSVTVTGNCAGGLTATSSPAVTFTTAVAPPANDLCANAIALTCGQTVTGTTVGATATGAPTGTCGTAVRPAGGVFYSYLGTGDIVTVSTCSGPTGASGGGDTKLFVLSGTCGTFTCVDGNDDIGSATCGNNSSASAVTFTSVAGTQYYFYVQPFTTATPFGLSVTCVAPPACAPITGLTAANVTSNSANLTFTAGNGNTSYTVTYTPAGGTAQTATGTASPIALTGLLSGTSYSVSVQPICSGGGTSAPTTTTFTTAFPVPANDLCAGATAITCGQTLNGTTLGATTTGDPTASCSSITPSSSPSVFYSFVGTGDIVTVSTCTAATTIDTKLFIYSGTCGALTCVTSNDDDSNCTNTVASTATFTSVVGTTYYFMVQRFGSGNTGAFALNVSCVAPPCNAPTALVASAITPSSATVSFTGSASAANGYTVTTVPATTTQTLAASATSVSFTGLTASTAYTVSIVSNCSATSTSSPATVSFTTTAPAPVCNAPTALATSSVTQTAASVSFTAGTGNTSFTASATPQGGGAAITATGTASPLSLTGLAAGTTYVLSLQAVCAGGGTTAAVTSTFSTPAAPCNAPTALAASAITSNSATVSFTGSASATGYTVTTTPVTTTQTLTASATSVSFTGLTASTAYMVSIVSNCAGGATSSAATVSFTTTAPAPQSLTVTNGQNITASGAYTTITVQSGGTLTLGGPTSATGAVQIQTGGLFITACQTLTGAGSFELQTGAELRICDPAGITTTGATGAVQLAGTRTYASDASYTYNGTTAQVTGSGLPATVRNLTVNNATGLSLSQGVSITQVARLTSGNLTTTGQAFTLLSSATGTALIDNTGGIVTGTGIMQRAITSANPLGYRHYSTPVTQTAISTLGTPTTNPAYNTSSTPGTVSPFPTVFGYDESRVGTVTSNYGPFDQGWFSPASGSTLMQLNRGYTVNTSGSTLVNFTGTFNNAAQNSGSLSRGANAQSGWQFLGNPYPSPLDWSTVTGAQMPGMDGSMYVFQSAGQYAGTYRSYQNGVGGASPLIDAGSGYFARVAAPGTPGAVNLSNANRVTTFGAQPAFGRNTADTRPQLHLQLTGASLSDDAFLYLEAGASAGLDTHYDATKLANPSGLDLASLAGTEALAINGLAPLTTTDVVVPLTMRVPQAGSFTFEAASLANFGSATVYLRDALAGTQQVLTAGTRYAFTLATATAGNGRFSVVFRPAAVTATTAGLSASTVSVYPNPTHSGSFTLLLPPLAGQREVRATLLNVLGQVVLSRTISLTAAGATAEFDTHLLATGVYNLQLTTGNQALTTRVVVE